MKKNYRPILALVLALFSLIICATGCTNQESPADDSAGLLALQQENEALRAQIDTLSAQVDSLYSQLELLAIRLDALESGVVSASCSLFVDSWEEQDETLVLTSAFIQVQLPADVTIQSTQLVLTHNGAESARVDIFLDSGEEAGSYHQSLTDTWFFLPEMEDDDYLDLYLEVTLSNGEELTASGISWYRTNDSLYDLVG